MIAVTGGTGVLGKFLVDALTGKGVEVLLIARKNASTDAAAPKVRRAIVDIADPNGLADAFQTHRVSLVIHAAALVSFDPRDRRQLLHTNVEGTRNVVNACLAAGVPRVIHISSVAAFGRPRYSELIDENAGWADSNLNSYYAESKYLAELEVFRGQEEGLGIDLVNPSVILAPSPKDQSSARIFHYVRKQRSFYTSGRVHYVDVRDVTAAVIRLVEQGPTGTKFILNGGTATVKDLLDQVAARLVVKKPGFRVPDGLLQLLVQFEKFRSLATGSAPLVTGQELRGLKSGVEYNSQKATRELGIRFRSLEETLDWCCEFYRDVYKKQSTSAS